MATFHVLCLETGKPYEDETGVVVLSDGRLAADFAKELTIEKGTKYQPRPVADVDWKAREAKRLEDGTYTRVPWDTAFSREYVGWWFQLRKPEAEHHYAHVSLTHPGCIAFTETDEKGARDIQTPMKPGRYLTKFYNLDESNIRDFANAFIAIYGDVKLAFADTADEFERIYTYGPNSCMAHSASEYSSRFHPVRVYAAGDLAVAYLTTGKGDDENITARALCWPTKKKFGRVYGDDKIITMLEADGWQHDEYMAEGARMLRKMQDDAYIVPYVDRIGSATDNGQFLIIDSRGEINCEFTNGLSEPMAMCDRCDDTVTEDERYYIDSRDASWCERCYSNHAFYCEVTESVIANDDGVRMADDTYWSERRFSREGATCEATGERFPIDDVVFLEDGTCWSRDYFADNGFQCDATGELFSNDDLNETPDGQKLGPSAYEDWLADQPEEEPETPARRKHVARQGRDELPGQLELPLIDITVRPHTAIWTRAAFPDISLGDILNMAVQRRTIVDLEFTP